MLGTGDCHGFWVSSLDNSLNQVLEEKFKSNALKDNINVKWADVSRDYCRKIGNFNAFKTDKQCKERWMNHLNPQLKKLFF